MQFVIIEKKVFEAVAYTLKEAVNAQHIYERHRYSVCKEEGPENIEKHVRNWSKLNELAYIKQSLKTEFACLYKYLNFSGTFPTISQVQLYKWLIAITDNIDATEKDKKQPPAEDEFASLLFLKVVKTQVLKSIVEDSHEYLNARWSTYSSPSHLRIVAKEEGRQKKAPKHPDPHTKSLFALIELSVQMKEKSAQEGLQNFFLHHSFLFEDTHFIRILRGTLKAAFWNTDSQEK